MDSLSALPALSAALGVPRVERWAAALAAVGLWPGDGAEIGPVELAALTFATLAASDPSDVREAVERLIYSTVSSARRREYAPDEPGREVWSAIPAGEPLATSATDALIAEMEALAAGRHLSPLVSLTVEEGGFSAQFECVAPSLSGPPIRFSVDYEAPEGSRFAVRRFAKIDVAALVAMAELAGATEERGAATRPLLMASAEIH